MYQIASTELKMMVRNRLVALTAIATPLLFAFVIFGVRDLVGGEGPIAALQVVVIAATGLYYGATTTLAGRRQTLYLKRLRSGVLSDAGVIAGIVLPQILVNLLQIVVVLGVMTAIMTPPANVWLVILGVVLAELMFTGFALATSGVTNSPEHAQFTSLPLYLVTILAVAWAAVPFGNTPPEWLVRALPGGALAELIQAGWSGAESANVLLLAGISLGWAAIAVLVAWKMFRWEPRR